MVYLTRQWLYSLFMLMFPLMVAANWLGGRGQRGGSHRRKMRAYTAQMAELELKLEQTRAADERRRREDAMDPAQVLLTATGPRRRLWERRADDPDTLKMRIGLFDGPATIQLVPAAKDAALPAVPTSFCVPVSMRLDHDGRARPGRAGRRIPGAGPLAGRPGRGPAQPARPVHRRAGRRPRGGPALELGALAAALRAARRRGLRRARRHRPRVGVEAGNGAGRRGHRADGEGRRGAGFERVRRRERAGCRAARAGGRQRPGAEDPGRAGRSAAAAPDPRHAAGARRRQEDRRLRGLHRRVGARAAGGMRRGAVLGHPRAGKRQPRMACGSGPAAGRWHRTAPRRRRCGRS